MWKWSYWLYLASSGLHSTKEYITCIGQTDRYKHFTFPHIQTLQTLTKTTTCLTPPKPRNQSHQNLNQKPTMCPNSLLRSNSKHVWIAQYVHTHTKLRISTPRKVYCWFKPLSLKARNEKEVEVSPTAATDLKELQKLVRQRKTSED